MEIGDVVLAIQKGEFDDSLDRLDKAVRIRKEYRVRALGLELEVGARVRIKNIGMGGKYINGLLATVQKVNPTTVWVQLLPEERVKISGKRLATAGKIKIPLSCVDVVQASIHFQGELPQ